MGAPEMDLAKLQEPFPAHDIEWRIGRAGKNDNGIWAKVLAYVTNRAIQDRLDEVCGPGNWRNEYREGPGGGVLCGLSVRVDGEWVTKWDGADNTEIEAVKGGLSGAMKRAAVQWGVGRYLYWLPEGWAHVHPDGVNYGRLPQDKGGDSFYWDPPALPVWAEPGGNGRPGPGEMGKVDRQTGEIREKASPSASAPSTNGGKVLCPSCGTNEVWDNRAKKASGKFSEKSPDYACKDKEGCGWTLWLDGALKKIEAALDHLLDAGAIDAVDRDVALEKARTGEIHALREVQDFIREQRVRTEVPSGS